MTAGKRQPNARSPNSTMPTAMANLPISGCGQETSSPASQRQRLLGADAAVHDGLGVLGVVHLVEHVLRGRGQLVQAQRRGDQQDERDHDDATTAAGGPGRLWGPVVPAQACGTPSGWLRVGGHYSRL